MSDREAFQSKKQRNLGISPKIKLITALGKKLWSIQISPEKSAFSFVFWARSGP